MGKHLPRIFILFMLLFGAMTTVTAASAVATNPALSEIHKKLMELEPLRHHMEMCSRERMMGYLDPAQGDCGQYYGGINPTTANPFLPIQNITEKLKAAGGLIQAQLSTEGPTPELTQAHNYCNHVTQLMATSGLIIYTARVLSRQLIGIAIPVLSKLKHLLACDGKQSAISQAEKQIIHAFSVGWGQQHQSPALKKEHYDHQTIQDVIATINKFKSHSEGKFKQLQMLYQAVFSEGVSLPEMSECSNCFVTIHALEKLFRQCVSSR
ncbi:MAG: hypothetical protein QG604_426 [Candidatus Dependentiae bacterium]|nr:hypothetical protein [Candidatus Dependentiae bacterium]